MDTKMTHTAGDRTPYVYHIAWTKNGINIHYIGMQYKRNCHPTNFWRTYFTSSKVVNEWIDYFGNPDIIEIRKTFDDEQKCREYEHKLLTKLNLKSNQHIWLNKSKGKCPRGKEGPNKNNKKIITANLIRIGNVYNITNIFTNETETLFFTEWKRKYNFPKATLRVSHTTGELQYKEWRFEKINYDKNNHAKYLYDIKNNPKQQPIENTELLKKLQKEHQSKKKLIKEKYIFKITNMLTDEIEINFICNWIKKYNIGERNIKAKNSKFIYKHFMFDPITIPDKDIDIYLNDFEPINSLTSPLQHTYFLKSKAYEIFDTINNTTEQMFFIDWCNKYNIKQNNAREMVYKYGKYRNYIFKEIKWNENNFKSLISVIPFK
jgi:hypothetical protein